MLLNAEWPAKCHSPPSHPFLPWHPICCGAPVWPGVLSTHLYITSSHPAPLQSHLLVPIWMMLEKAQDHDSQAQTNTDLVFGSAGMHLICYTCEHCKVSEWQIISGWKSKRAFLLHISAQPPSPGGPQSKACGLLCTITPTQTSYWLPFSLCFNCDGRARKCRENLIETNTKAIAVGTSLSCGTYVATQSSSSGGAGICCIFLYTLASCNVKSKKVPGCFSDVELQEEFTARQPDCPFSFSPSSAPALIPLRCCSSV